MMNENNNLLKNKDVANEYCYTLLLTRFGKLCNMAEKDKTFKSKLRDLYMQSNNKVRTVQLIFQKNLQHDLNHEDSKMVLLWFEAWLRKNNSRKVFTELEKNELAKRQNFTCNICKKKFDDDLSNVHVDHIIPWKLVGDELENNLQLLCLDCNLHKSDNLDYSFRTMIGLK